VTEKKIQQEGTELTEKGKRGRANDKGQSSNDKGNPKAQIQGGSGLIWEFVTTDCADGDRIFGRRTLKGDNTYAY
jgi:hypothetical protein